MAAGPAVWACTLALPLRRFSQPAERATLWAAIWLYRTLRESLPEAFSGNVAARDG
jgi:hypothetical protein